jgi:hypothetical protein
MRITIDKPLPGLYVAAEEDWDLGWPTGLGRTQEEAIADLLSQRDLGPETEVEVV